MSRLTAKVSQLWGMFFAGKHRCTGGGCTNLAFVEFCGEKWVDTELNRAAAQKQGYFMRSGATLQRLSVLESFALDFMYIISCGLCRYALQ